MPDILFYALVAGYGVTILAAPMGCFVLWRRMVYFGDTLSHSALLGVALGLILDINIHLAVILYLLAIAMVMVNFQDKQRIASDTMLGILALSSLSIALVAISIADNIRVDMMSYLFGDLLAINLSDIYLIYGIGVVVLVILTWLWKPLLSMTIHSELAQVEGIPVKKLKLALNLLMAAVIAVAMKIVGTLLITSLMIIPAATAQRFAKTPEQMVFFSVVVGLFGISGGLTASWYLDSPAGPSVVVCSFLIFILFLIIQVQKNK